MVAWQGVGLVGDQVTDERPPHARPPTVAAELAGTAPTADARHVLHVGAGRHVVTEPADCPAPTGGPVPEPVVRSYRVTGGTAALALTPAGVTVAYAAPDLGYQMRSEADDGGWRIEFEARPAAAASRAGGTAGRRTGSRTPPARARGDDDD